MRGEGNHKIPGSFAPENMEKTGAERVKYSLACQHEDAISIKFVSYAQKCPTVLCTFAVALRKESVDRNSAGPRCNKCQTASLSARRAWNVSLSDCSGGGVHADIRFNFKNCYSKKLSHKIKNNINILYDLLDKVPRQGI